MSLRGKSRSVSGPPENVAESGKRAPGSGSHAGIALAVIAAAQLMLVVDGTIMNVALPSIQVDFHISAATLAWIVNAYALAFGGLLLLGGRAGDLFGRRRIFRFGIGLFTAASLLGGLAPDEVTLIMARTLQGVGAAIAAPAALSLIATTFSEGPSRNRAMGVYGAMLGLGSTVGLLAGGVLTEYLNWRWVLFVNVPIGAAVLFGSTVLVEGERDRGRLDIPGAITGTAGLTALVYAITRGGTDGWADAGTVTFFAGGVVLLVVFLAIQRTSAAPTLPLRLLRDRNRGGAYATMLLVGCGMFATYFFLTLYMQLILGYGAMETGLAYLPFSIGIGVTAGYISPRLLARVTPRWVTAPGLLLAIGGMFWLSTLTTRSGYPTHLMPAMIVTALGLGLIFVPMTLSAVSGTTQEDAGIASGVLNTGIQVGGALGLAVLTTLAAAAANARLPRASEAFFQGRAAHDAGLVARAADALTHGYGRGFVVGALAYAAALVVVLVAINTTGPRPPAESDQDAAHSPQPAPAE